MSAGQPLIDFIYCIDDYHAPSTSSIEKLTFLFLSSQFPNENFKSDLIKKFSWGRPSSLDLPLPHHCILKVLPQRFLWKSSWTFLGIIFWDATPTIIKSSTYCLPCVWCLLLLTLVDAQVSRRRWTTRSVWRSATPPCTPCPWRATWTWVLTASRSYRARRTSSPPPSCRYPSAIWRRSWTVLVTFYYLTKDSPPPPPQPAEKFWLVYSGSVNKTSFF